MAALLAIAIGFVSVGSIIRSVSVTGHSAPLSLADFEVARPEAGSSAKAMVIAAVKPAEPAPVASGRADTAPPPPPAAVVPLPTASAVAAPPAAPATTPVAPGAGPAPAPRSTSPVVASQQVDPALARRAAEMMNDTNSAIDRILPKLSSLEPAEPAKPRAAGLETAAAEPLPVASVDTATKPHMAHIKSVQLRRKVKVATLIPRHKPVRLARAKPTYVHRVRAAVFRHLTTKTLMASNQQVRVRVYLGRHIVAVHVPRYLATADAGSD